MNFELKLFSWPDPGPHVVALVKGTIDADSLTQIFRKIGDMTRPLSHGQVLIDLVDAVYALDCADIEDILSEGALDQWAANIRIALVSLRDAKQYDGVVKFSTLLSNRRINVAAFCSLRLAVDWLAVGRHSSNLHI
jgi:hypothetical protein